MSESRSTVPNPLEMLNGFTASPCSKACGLLTQNPQGSIATSQGGNYEPSNSVTLTGVTFYPHDLNALYDEYLQWWGALGLDTTDRMICGALMFTADRWESLAMEKLIYRLTTVIQETGPKAAWVTG